MDWLLFWKMVEAIAVIILGIMLWRETLRNRF